MRRSPKCAHRAAGSTAARASCRNESSQHTNSKGQHGGNECRAVSIDGNMVGPDDRLLASPCGFCHTATSCVRAQVFRPTRTWLCRSRRAVCRMFPASISAQRPRGRSTLTRSRRMPRTSASAALFLRGASQLGQDHIAYPLTTRNAVRLREFRHSVAFFFRQLRCDAERREELPGRCLFSLSDSVFKSVMRTSHFSGAPKCT